MAQRTFNEFRHSLEKKVVDLFCNFTVGATGAPTLVAAKSKGVASISRTSPGLYVITLQDRYVRFLGIRGTFKVAAPAVPSAPVIQLSAETVATTKTITIQFVDLEVPAATELASGEEIYLTITLCDSTAF